MAWVTITESAYLSARKTLREAEKWLYARRATSNAHLWTEERRAVAASARIALSILRRWREQEEYRKHGKDGRYLPGAA